MERVCLVSAAPLGPPGQRKWNDITQPHSHTTLYYIASGVGHLYEQCALIHYAGRWCKRKEQVFPFWDVKKRRGDIMRYISGFQDPGPSWFSCSTAKQRLITAGKQGECNS